MSGALAITFVDIAADETAGPDLAGRTCVLGHFLHTNLAQHLVRAQSVRTLPRFIVALL